MGVIYIMAYNMQWNSVDEVKSDLNNCMSYMKQFVEIYNHKQPEQDYRIYAEEGFKSFMRAYFELVNAYITFCMGVKPNYQKYGTYRAYLKEVAFQGYIPEESITFLDMLRKLRNSKAHGYLLPEFELLLNVLNDHEDKFDNLTLFIMDM